MFYHEKDPFALFDDHAVGSQYGLGNAGDLAFGEKMSESYQWD